MSVQFKGCNLAGGDSPYTRWPSTGPVLGTNYQFASPADVDYHMSKGQNTFRVLFTWEALQPTEYANIATLAGAYAKYRDTLYALVSYITSKGANVILDIHGGSSSSFGTYKSVPVGKLTASGQKVEDLLANLWRQLADRFKLNPRVWYGVMNEPQGITPSAWFVAAQKVINSIRSTGVTAPIIMPGSAWTGASTWMSSGNASAWNLMDPVGNLHVQLHLYFDTDASGVTTDIASATVGSERLRDAVAWARGKGLKLFLGEVGLSASNPLGAAAWANLVAYTEANADVVMGWCWWAAGPPSWWGNYQFTLCPSSSGDSAQMKLIAPSFGVASVPAPAPAPAPVDTTAALQAEIDALKATIAGLRADVLSLTADVEEYQEAVSVERSARLKLQMVVDAVRLAVAS